MKYRTFAAVIAAMFMLTGCGKENKAASIVGGTDAPTSAVVAGQVEAEEYEFYIDEIDYSMDKYFSSHFSVRSALAFEDWVEAKEHIESEIKALGELEKSVCPSDLEDVHSKLIYAVGLAKEYEEGLRDYIGYMEYADSLSPEDKSEFDALNAELDEIQERINENGALATAWINVRKAAFSRLPNGENKAYGAELEILRNTYASYWNLLTDVLFNGASDNLLSLSDTCLSLLSLIEDMDVPEQMKSYHNDILEAIPTERNFCQATNTIAELKSEYQGLEFEELPADVQRQIQECSDTINTLSNEENPEFYALDNAVCAALDFVDQQAG